MFELFPYLRVAIIETGGGWLPLALDRLDTHYVMSPDHVPNLKRLPREVVAEGRYFHAIDSWERSMEFCVNELGEDLWLFATRLAAWRHAPGRRACSRSPRALVSRQSAKRKMLGENALRLCPRLKG